MHIEEYIQHKDGQVIFFDLHYKNCLIYPHLLDVSVVELTSSKADSKYVLIVWLPPDSCYFI